MQEKTLPNQDNSTSNIHSMDLGSVSYDIFGSPYQKSGSFLADDSLDFGYLGKPYNADTELYDYGFRDYSPEIARFTTIDPIRDGRNWYSYVVNDPVNYVDLWGLCKSESDTNSRKTYLVISTFRGGGTENMGETFIDAANTKAKEIQNSDSFNPEKDILIVKDIDSVEELKQLLSAGNIDSLDMFGHGGADFLVIGSGDGPGKREQLNKSNLLELNKNAFNENASITLYQCNTANEDDFNFIEKMFGAKTIAEQMANYFNVDVTGFKSGSTAVPSPDAVVDYSFIHKRGDDVYFKSRQGTKTYKK